MARTGKPEKALLVDRDQEAVTNLGEKFGKEAAKGPEIRQSDFLTVSHELIAVKRKFDLILADLGVSSPHLNEAARGFSIARNGPLDMRMDQSQNLTAETIVNTYSEADLANILREYGQEPKARQIARNVIAERPLRTTGQLAAIVAKAWPGKSRNHPATRTFQALRIAVNDELGQLETSLPLWLKMLNPGGRIAVISFHSLEDRIVKQFLLDHAGDTYDSELKLLTKKPVTASINEIVSNPRARSAKLRAAAKIKNI